MTSIETTVTRWDELYPDGARRFYEGDDPKAFRAEIIEEFGFDPATDDPECEDLGWPFTIPTGLVGAIYGSERWELGS